MSFIPNQSRLDTPAAAKYLGVSTSTLETWRSRSRGPRFIKLGRRVLYQIKDLDSYAAARVVETCDTASILQGGSDV